MKIGQEIVVKEDFKINTIVSDKVMTVKEGDKGFLDSKGLIHITTGNGRGKIVKINDVEVEGYDHANISKLILDRLNRVFNMEEFLDDNDISAETFEVEIEDILMDIL
ncbi:hypothetical protein PN398_07945 [Romboutsia sp. 1001216sp1]|uniref:hypothetical protein n=1 Tax=unclassified Romboutsia TaxID=2626894 RepID=UPI00189E7304|nr:MULTISPECIES: hypothetical protein [unclassified Romboutsia]MDB8790650.1 hypothetical protein [Romboutsia sp. 1001216sp1]MDB8803269.1 hypothetical protein [Romboutsia sp. 1001216sp1]MDB8814623.1 hypothetical protein [Romboutsia sp. 1001216sp1]